MIKEIKLKPLISKTATGDHEAFEQLISSQMNFISGKTRCLTRSSEDAEDVSQKVMLNVYRRIGTLKYPEAFTSWLNSIIVRECQRFYADKNEIVSYDDAGDLENLITDNNEDYFPHTQIERAERIKSMRAAIDRLPAPFKNMIKLYYDDEMCYKKIAAHMGVTVGAVSAGLHRAKKRLRKDLLQS